MTDCDASPGWSGRDTAGCLAVHLAVWGLPTILLLGFAGSVPALVGGVVGGVARGDLLAISYVLLTLGWVPVAVATAQSLWRRRSAAAPGDDGAA
jgi:hypothetical protein